MTVTAINVYQVTYQLSGAAETPSDPNSVAPGANVQTVVLAQADGDLSGIIAADLGVSSSQINIVEFTQLPSDDGNVHQ